MSRGSSQLSEEFVPEDGGSLRGSEFYDENDSYHSCHSSVSGGKEDSPGWEGEDPQAIYSDDGAYLKDGGEEGALYDEEEGDIYGEEGEYNYEDEEEMPYEEGWRYVSAWRHTQWIPGTALHPHTHKHWPHPDATLWWAGLPQAAAGEAGVVAAAAAGPRSDPASDHSSWSTSGLTGRHVSTFHFRLH